MKTQPLCYWVIYMVDLQLHWCKILLEILGLPYRIESLQRKEKGKNNGHCCVKGKNIYQFIEQIKKASKVFWPNRRAKISQYLKQDLGINRKDGFHTPCSTSEHQLLLALPSTRSRFRSIWSPALPINLSPPDNTAQETPRASTRGRCCPAGRGATPGAHWRRGRESTNRTHLAAAKATHPCALLYR